jgi:hypothetical protein
VMPEAFGLGPQVEDGTGDSVLVPCECRKHLRSTMPASLEVTP